MQNAMRWKITYTTCAQRSILPGLAPEAMDRVVHVIELRQASGSSV